MILHMESGGIDSTTLLYQHLADGNPVECIGFHYGQTHFQELDCARRITQKLGVKFQVVELSKVFGGSSLVGGIGSVVVPNRNAVMLNIACAIAESRGCKLVTFGATAEDYAGFPDCRPAFVDRLNDCLCAAELSVRVSAPYINLTKREVALIGKKLGVPFEETLSCYKGTKCGECDACKKREAALCGL